LWAPTMGGGEMVGKTELYTLLFMSEKRG
jgi:hypothetical protein